jgi:hypothetical protein
MNDTPHLDLPLLAAAQAQKHVTHNEALALLDALVHLAVKERDRQIPPGDPQEGDRYIVGAGAVGAFAAHDGAIALFDLGAWRFLRPRAGWQAYVAAERCLLVHDGAGWNPAGRHVGRLDELEALGVGTAADEVNRLAAKLNAALFTARGGEEGGTGDLRFVLNKEEAGNVLSQLYQRGYSGRAEVGLVGDDDFCIRVSADGSTWRDALKIDGATGVVTFPAVAGDAGDPAGNLLLNPELAVNQRAFPGGPLAHGVYGFDRWKGGPGGCTVARAADGAITLNGALTQVIEAPGLAGRTVTVSVENPSAPLTVTVEGATASITPGAGRRSATLAVPAASTGHVTLTLAASGATFARPALNRGGAAEPFRRLPAVVDLLTCQRYFAKTFAPATAPAPAAGTAGALTSHAIVPNVIAPVLWRFPVAMRILPLLTFFNPIGGNAQWSSGGVVASVVAGSATTESVRIGHSAPATIAAGTTTLIHAVADAEL